MAPLRIASFLTLLLGIVLGGFAGVRASAMSLPLFVTLAGAAILEIVLAIGIARRSRVAWAFAVAASGILAVTVLLAMPAMIRGGMHAALGAAAIATVGAQLALLVTLRREF